MSERKIEAPEFDRFFDCIHCGLCLPVCPTYQVLGTEMDSPRGRVYLMRSLAEGTIALDKPYEEHIDACLVCRACETACPSGVQFGEMMEAARAQREYFTPSPLKKFLLSIVHKPRMLRLGAALLRAANRTGAIAFAGKWKGALGFLVSLLPAPPATHVWKAYDSEIIPAVGSRRYRVGFLRGCVADALFSGVNLATIRVLAVNGCEIVMPRGQTCCGALHAHNGLRNTTREWARQNIDAFLDAGVDAVVSNAAGCGATMKGYGALLKDDPRYAARAKEFSTKTRDISEFLASIELQPFTHSIDAVVAYHDACHLAHGQGIRKQPRELLAEIPGLRLAELNDGEMCCGSAGIYNILQSKLSRELQRQKMNAIRRTGATIVAAANPGCAMQIASGALRHGLVLRTAHPVELIAEAYGIRAR